MFVRRTRALQTQQITCYCRCPGEKWFISAVACSIFLYTSCRTVPLFKHGEIHTFENIRQNTHKNNIVCEKTVFVHATQKEQNWACSASGECLIDIECQDVHYSILHSHKHFYITLIQILNNINIFRKMKNMWVCLFVFTDESVLRGIGLGAINVGTTQIRS